VFGLGPRVAKPNLDKRDVREVTAVRLNMADGGAKS
jgi:hypothetical protein